MTTRLTIAYNVVDLTLRTPFVSGKGRVDAFRQGIVEVGCGGITGYGTASFAPEYGMTEAAVGAAISIVNATLDGLDAIRFDTPNEIMARVSSFIADQTSAMAALDMALYDLFGKLLGVPAYQLLGLPAPSNLMTGLSLGALTKSELCKLAQKYGDWPILKLKMRTDSDPSLAASIRTVYQGRLWVDANGSWDCENAATHAAALGAAGVELLEQPVAAGDLRGLEHVHKTSTIRVVADESCRDEFDIERLVGKVDGINVKLLKCGGLGPALRLILAARATGLSVMIGCKTESTLGITAAAQLAGLVDYLDLDGHLDVVNDPFAGTTVDKGRMVLQGGCGLGISRKGA